MRWISSVVGISTTDFELRLPRLSSLIETSVRDILRDVAAAPGIFQKGLQRHENFFGLSAGQIREQFVAKGIDTRRRQLRQLLAADARIDVQFSVPAILLDGRTFAAFELHECDPIFGRFGDRKASAGEVCMPWATSHLDRRVIARRRLFFAQGLNMPFATGIVVVDDPGGLRFALRVFPCSFTDRHRILPFSMPP